MEGNLGESLVQLLLLHVLFYCGFFFSSKFLLAPGRMFCRFIFQTEKRALKCLTGVKTTIRKLMTKVWICTNINTSKHFVDPAGYLPAQGLILRLDGNTSHVAIPEITSKLSNISTWNVFLWYSKILVLLTHGQIGKLILGLFFFHPREIPQSYYWNI